ncbi:hypothetical protein FYJ26_03145 [Anaerococcus sp. WCA-380-WT-2B]|uniref:Uncharacterized protein n=1 Tax=Anaerococcus porci TaxID=2652269 RepID=A0A6N7VD90_9FIRM|nr:hypothetical protein [Anaerococcus porci]MSS77420.1 hypothetical protein [Anaerococcus porci]
MKEIQIKKHLYIDENLINSYLSQIFQGDIESLILNKSSNKSNEHEKNLQQNSRNTEFGTNFPIISAKIDLGSESVTDTLKDASSISSGQSIRKTYDAYAKINKFIETIHLEENEFQNSSIVLINKELSLIDFKKLKTIMSDDFFKEKAKSDINGIQIKEKLNRQERRRLSKDKKQNSANELNILKNLVEMLEFLTKIMPTDLMFYTENLLIPIDAQKLLCDPKQISYKFNNDLNIIGEVIGNLNSINSFDIKAGEFTGIESMINSIVIEILTNALGINPNDTILLRPIVLYSQTPLQTSLKDY